MATKFTYSESEVVQIVAKYERGESLEALADEYNKSVPSVRMKLVKLGVYKAATKTSTGSTTKPKLTKREEARANRLLFEDLLYEHGTAPF